MSISWCIPELYLQVPAVFLNWYWRSGSRVTLAYFVSKQRYALSPDLLSLQAMPNSRAMNNLKPYSRVWVIMKFGGKTCNRLLKRGLRYYKLNRRLAIEIFGWWNTVIANTIRHCRMLLGLTSSFRNNWKGWWLQPLKTNTKFVFEPR